MSITVSLNGITEFIHQKSGPAGTANFDGGIPTGPAAGADSSFTWVDNVSNGLIDPLYLGVEDTLRVWSVSLTMAGQSTWSLNKISGLTSVSIVSGTDESTFVLGQQVILGRGEKLSLVTTGTGTTFVKMSVSVAKIDFVGLGTAPSLVAQALDSNAVHIRGDETILGIKNFVESPLVPYPTLPNQAASKLYVDDVAAAGASPTFAAPVATLDDLRAVPPSEIVDRQIRLVESIGALYRYDENTGAGVPDDDSGVIKPDLVSLGSDGRWYKSTALVQNHENLLGLLGGAPGDHQHITSEQLAALAGTSGTTVGSLNKLVDDSDPRLSDRRTPVEHAATHLPNGTDPLATSTPVAIGTSNTTGTANSFARADHVHAHGQQTDGGLHALATSSVHGFMSSTDKAKLDTVSSYASVAGSGAADGVAYWTNATTVTYSNKLKWTDSTSKFDVTGDVSASGKAQASAVLQSGLYSGEAMAAGSILYVDSMGKVRKAIANDTAKCSVVGVLEAATVGNEYCNAYVSHRADAFSGLTSGIGYFLSDSAAGGVSTYASLSSGSRIIFLGYAVSSSAIQLNIQDRGTKP